MTIRESDIAAIDHEARLIGKLFVYPDELDDISSVLSPSDFYGDNSRKIFSAMMTLRDNKMDISEMNVINSVDGICEELLSANYLEYAFPPISTNEATKAIKEAAYKIKLLNYSRRLTELGAIKNIGLEQIHSEIKGICAGGVIVEQQSSHISECADLAVLDVLERHEKDAGGLIKTTNVIDSSLNGFDKGNLIYVAARPGGGKTALMGNIAVDAAKSGASVLFITLEMSTVEITRRFLANASDVSNNRMRSGRISDKCIESMENGRVALGRLPIHISDDSSINAYNIKTFVKKHMIDNPTDIVIIDYVQLMGATHKEFIKMSDYQRISVNSASFKDMAKELDVVVFAGCQIGRDYEQDNGTKPKKKDLKGSGSLEQDADYIIAPWALSDDDQKLDHAIASDDNTEAFMVSCIKNRHGSLFDQYSHFNKSFQRFTIAIDPSDMV